MEKKVQGLVVYWVGIYLFFGGSIIGIGHREDDGVRRGVCYRECLGCICHLHVVMRKG